MTPDEVQAEKDRIENHVREYMAREESWEPMFDRLGLRAEFESIENDLRRVADKIVRIDALYQLGHLDAFSELSGRIRKAKDHAYEALTSMFNAKLELNVRHLPRTRRHQYRHQRRVVRLCVFILDGQGRGAARAAALEIMQKLGLEVPDDSTLTRWIGQARRE